MKNADKRAGVLTVAIAAMTLAIGARAMASSAATVSLLGDANADAVFGVADAVLFSKYLGNGDTLSAQGAANSDMNGDAALNAIDLTLMKRQLLNAAPVDPNGDHVVTAITYGESSVTLKNANGAVVNAADATNVTVADNTMVTINTPGEYDVSGDCTNGQLKINCDKTTYALGQVTCNLLGLNLSNSSDSPIYVAAIDDEFVLTVKNGYTNTISDGTSYTNADAGVGAIYSCDDMKIKGQGTLIVKGNCEDGIVCKNDLKIWNGDIQVTAVDDGIRGKDSVRIGDPDDLDYTSLKVNVTTSTGDGIKSTDEKDTTHGFVRVTGGTVTVNSCGDAIFGVYSVEINGGSLNLSTTGSNSSAKGLKAGYTDDTTSTEYTGNVTVNGGYLYAKTNDDCINANGDVNILGGQLELQTIQTTTGNQAIHADDSCYLGADGGAYSDFELVIYNAYEGIEAFNIYQKSGAIVVTSVDDAFNVAGGADNSGSSGMWPGQGGMGGSGGVLEISGGFSIVSVANGDHDGYDSNGSITISGGICISNGQEPFDSDSGITYTGGVYIKNAGSGGMGGGFPGMGGGSSMTETVNVSATIAAGERVTLCDASGNVIVSFINDKSASSLIAGCTAYSGASFYTGGTLNGSTYFQEMDDTQLAAYGGTLSGGTVVTGSGSGNTNPWG